MSIIDEGAKEDRYAEYQRLVARHNKHWLPVVHTRMMSFIKEVGLLVLKKAEEANKRLPE